MAPVSHDRNRLLARLPPLEYKRLLELVRLVPLELKQVIHKFREPIQYVYFPIRGAASAVTIMEDGSAIEVATIGNEGVVGHSIFDGDDESSPYEVFIQVAGEAIRMDIRVFKQECARRGPFGELLLRYNKAFLTQISQSVACNGLHSVQQRCCRWLLITRDRLETDAMPLTHEFLGVMLGVRRSTVTEVLGPLHDQGLINNSRGEITILDRAGLEKICCECYRKVKDEFDRLLG